jgi:cyclophilin family peptidyl-prolyl cis-trans isomerase
MNLFTNLLIIFIILILFIIFLKIRKSKRKEKEQPQHRSQQQSFHHSHHNNQTYPKKSCIKKYNGQNKKHNKKVKIVEPLPIHKKQQIIQKPQNYIYLTIEINGNKVGNIIIKLFDNVVPKTCNNFRILCKTKKYINTPFHRIIKDFMIQGGDYTNHNGTGGKSIYGEKFEDENFILKHDKPYLLSMANAGPNTNGSQFFITTTPTPHLDGKHVVFGEVVKGFEIIYELNSTETANSDMPIDRIVIADCGSV